MPIPMLTTSTTAMRMTASIRRASRTRTFISIR